MSTGNDYKALVLDAMYGSGHTADFPNTVYLALFTTQVLDDGTGTEVAATDYARLAITNNSTNFPDAVGDLKRLATEQVWAEAEEDWGTIVWWALMDASTDGSVISHGQGGGSNPPNHTTGKTFRIPPNTLTIQVA